MYAVGSSRPSMRKKRKNLVLNCLIGIINQTTEFIIAIDSINSINQLQNGGHIHEYSKVKSPLVIVKTSLRCSM